jgi:eukaryotic-like serine/threonine-protein kinase
LTEDVIPPSRFRPKVARDLETICLKCLEKAPQKRYSSAEVLADDLQRFLRGEPIQARPISTWGRTIKWIKRRPAVAALVTLGAMATIGVVAGVLFYQVQRTRLAEQGLILAEKEFSESHRLEAARAKIQGLLLESQKAVSAQQWKEALSQLASASAMMEPGLEDMMAQLHGLEIEANRGAEQQAALQRAVEKRRYFFELRDTALFHGTLFKGVDVPAYPMLAREQGKNCLGSST